MLDEAKAKSERHKSSWFAYKWFWREVYLVALLSLYCVSLFNKSEMGWSFDDESTRASPDVYEKHDRIINIHVRLIWHVSNVLYGNWWFSITEKKFLELRSMYLTYFFYFSDKILYCGAIQIEDTWKSGIQMWLSHNQGNLMYTDVNKCFHLDFFCKSTKRVNLGPKGTLTHSLGLILKLD